MSELIDTLRAIVRDELSRLRGPELGLVVAVYANDADGNNHQVDVRLRSSGVELQRVPVTVARYGVSMLPAVGELVLLVFVGGELNAPMVVGSVYDESTQPPEAGAAEVVYEVPDAGAERHLELRMPSGVSYTIDDGALKIAAGGTEVRLQQDGDIQISAAGNIELRAEGDIHIEAGANLVLKGGVGVEIEGPQIKINAAGQAELKAAVLKLAGMTQFSPG